MKAHFSRVHWDLVVKTAVLVSIVTFILGLALSLPVLTFSTGSAWIPIVPFRLLR
jgi:uncharacterized membrane protein